MSAGTVKTSSSISLARNDQSASKPANGTELQRKQSSREEIVQGSVRNMMQKFSGTATTTTTKTASAAKTGVTAYKRPAAPVSQAPMPAINNGSKTVDAPNVVHPKRSKTPTQHPAQPVTPTVISVTPEGKPEFNMNFAEPHLVNGSQSAPWPTEDGTDEELIRESQPQPAQKQTGHDSDYYDFGSPWLSERLRNIPEDKWKAMCPPNRNVATDTHEFNRERDNEMQKLRSHACDLECQLKIKKRELETNNLIEKELRRKLQNAEDGFELKRQMEQIEKQLDDQVRINQDLTDENAKLMDELADRNRKLLAHQAEIDNLDRMIASKNALKEDEIRAKLEQRLRDANEELDDKTKALAKAHREITMAHAEVRSKEKELELRASRLMDMQNDAALLRERINESETRNATVAAELRKFEREYAVMQSILDKKEPFNSILDRVTRENTELKNYVGTLEGKVALLQKDRETAHLLTQELREMHTALNEKNVEHLEKLKIAETLQMVEKLLKDKTVEEEALRKELITVQSYIRDLEEENRKHRDVDATLVKGKERLREAELHRVELGRRLAQTQRKLARLSQACMERNRFIEALVQELYANMTPNMTGRIERLTNQAKTMAQEELPYANPDYQPEPIPGEQVDLTNNNLRLLTRPSGGQRRAEDRTETKRDRRRTMNADDLYELMGSGHRYNNWLLGLGDQLPDSNLSQDKKCADYAPRRDYTGFYLSEESSFNPRAEQTKDTYLPVKRDLSTPYYYSREGGGLELGDGKSYADRDGGSTQKPGAPYNVRAKAVTDDEWLVEWDLPSIDHNELSNGVKIYVDDEEAQLISSPWMSKALIHINSTMPNRIGVQTIASTGKHSKISEGVIDLDDSEP